MYFKTTAAGARDSPEGAKYRAPPCPVPQTTAAGAWYIVPPEYALADNFDGVRAGLGPSERERAEDCL